MNIEDFTQMQSQTQSLIIACKDGVGRTLYFTNRDELNHSLKQLFDYGLIDPTTYNRYLHAFEDAAPRPGWENEDLEKPTLSEPMLENLSVKQKWLQENTEKEGKKLFGMKVKLLNFGNNLDGVAGIIVKITKERNHWAYTILDNDGLPHKAKINQLDPLVKINQLDPNNKGFVVDAVREKIQQRLIERSLPGAHCKELDSSAAFGMLFTKLQQHKYVHDAGVLEDGTIFVVTENLHPTSEATGKTNKKNFVGRFLFRISYAPSAVSIRVKNLDYKSGRYYHPNVPDDEHVCWGANSEEIDSMFTKFQIYELVDFTILFLGLLPQKEGDPYLSFTEWMNARQEHREEVNLPNRVI